MDSSDEKGGAATQTRAQCDHDLSERETACADGMCPMCLAARLAEAEREREALRELLREARPCVESWQRKHERALKAAKKRSDDHHAEWHRENVANAFGLKSRIDAALERQP